MRRTRLPVLGAVAGIAVGLLVAGGLVATGVLDDRTGTDPPPEASEEFIAAFQRSLEGTYAVRAEFTRELDDGRTLRSSASVVQRPPDTLRRQFGGITGVVAGRQVMCSSESSDSRTTPETTTTTAPGATTTSTEATTTTTEDPTSTTEPPAEDFHCGPSAPAPDHAQTVSQDMTNLRSYFAAPALYRAVEVGPGCYELTQVRASSVLPYGSFARFCFDDATGAVRLLVQHLEGAVDTFEATEIRGQVSADDFNLNEDSAFDPVTDGDTTTTTTS